MRGVVFWKCLFHTCQEKANNWQIATKQLLLALPHGQDTYRGTHGSIKYGPIQVLILTMNHRSLFNTPYLNGISIFNNYGESQITL